EGLQYCPQIEGRAADDLEDVGGGGLLLQRLVQFLRTLLLGFEQPDVLNRDYRLIGEGFDQLDLVIRERFDLSLQNRGDPPKRPFTEHRNRHSGTEALLFDQIGKFIIRQLQYIPDMNRASFKCSLACDGAWAWAQRMAVQVIGESGPRPVGRRKAEIFTVKLKNVTA